MATAYKTPGVYREDVYVRPPAALPTGVPGFVGFGQAKAGVAAPVMLHREEDLALRFDAPAGGYLPDVVAGFFANGGERCYIAGAPVPGDLERALNGPPPDIDRMVVLKQAVTALAAALDPLGPLADLDLVAVPDAMVLLDLVPESESPLRRSLLADAEHAMQRVQASVIAHCTDHRNRFAILDAPSRKQPAADAVAKLTAWRRQLAVGPNPAKQNLANAALYYPRVTVASTDIIGGRPVPSCGHVAGIYARSDARVGVFKAPANEELLGVLDLEIPIDSGIQDALNPEGINCLRAFPGRGLRVWGARTLSLDPSWRYINVRRLVLTLTRWIDRNLAWAPFEPNTPRLWLRIQRELSVYLDRLRQAGALKGASPAEAFYVKCDAETNPADAREQGRVTTEIGLAPASPAEFIVVRIIHRAGAAQLG